MAEKPWVNFELALTKLGDFIKNYDESEIQRAGIIQAFEFTFEQCWHSIQKIAGAEGVSIASPKKAFQWALEAQLIPTADEPIWLAMLNERNLTSHAYRESIAVKVLTNIQAHYCKAFQSLLLKMSEPGN